MPLITVFFPNPLLIDDETRQRQPDWTKLSLWNTIRQEFLGLPEDPADRVQAAS